MSGALAVGHEISATGISGLNIRLICGEGSMPSMWQFESDRMVVHSRAELVDEDE